MSTIKSMGVTAFPSRFKIGDVVSLKTETLARVSIRLDKANSLIKKFGSSGMYIFEKSHKFTVEKVNTISYPNNIPNLIWMNFSIKNYENQCEIGYFCELEDEHGFIISCHENNLLISCHDKKSNPSNYHQYDALNSGGVKLSGNGIKSNLKTILAENTEIDDLSSAAMRYLESLEEGVQDFKNLKAKKSYIKLVEALRNTSSINLRANLTRIVKG